MNGVDMETLRAWLEAEARRSPDVTRTSQSLTHCRCYNLAREDNNMQRRDVGVVLGLAIAALLFPATVQAKEETITLEVTGMS